MANDKYNVAPTVTNDPKTAVSPDPHVNMENPTAAPADGREDIFIPRGNANDDPNLFVSVNGVNYLLPKGKTSRVPKHIAEEIRRSQRAADIRENNIGQMLEAAQ